jgi:hypothetical protein
MKKENLGRAYEIVVRRSELKKAGEYLHGMTLHDYLLGINAEEDLRSFKKDVKAKIEIAEAALDEEIKNL